MKTKLGKRILKMVGFVLGIACFATVMQTELWAAGTVTVTTDKASAAIGETVTIAVQTSVPEDPATTPEVSVTYNADILTFTGCNVEYGGGGGLITFVGQSAAMTFTAAQTGSVTVAAEAIIDDDGNNPAVGSATITVGAQGGLSSDATLYALEMNPGQMVPDFSPQVTDYKIIIDNDVTDITVSGAVSDPGAQITAASGFKNLKEGTNEAIITVTAADGTTLSYHFSIERSEAAAAEDDAATEEEEPESEQMSNGLEVTIDDIRYTVQTVIADEILPEGCIKTSSNFNGEAVEAALFEKGGLTLLYVLAEDGNGEFFIYNESSGKLQLFLQLRSIENRYIIPIEGTEGTPATFKESKMQWNNSYIPAYILADTSVEHANEFYLLYALNNEGERAFYLYDTMEGTYQRFLNYTGAKTVEVSDGGDTRPFVIAIIVLVILLIGMVMLIVNIIISSRERRDDERYARRAKKRKPAKKPAAKPQPKPERRVVSEEETLLEEKEEEEVTAEVKQPEPKQVQPKPMQSSKHVTGAVGITGNIPIKVVQPPKSEVKRPQVPIYTLERQPVQLTREAPPDQLDDDFEFEFISMDNE